MLELDPHYPWQRTAGVDEAGRGPLFGPVSAAAVVLNPEDPIAGLDDSKRLSAGRRSELALQIRKRALAWQVAWCSAEEIDRYNILRASQMAMVRALEGLGSLELSIVLVDGNRVPRDERWCMEAVVKGDARHSAVAAASILAKVERDCLIDRLAKDYPGYGLERNKGYPTAEHRRALVELGPTPQHRRSFAPVRDAMTDQRPQQLEL